MKKIIFYFLLGIVLTACSETRESADFTLEVRDYYEETIYNFGNDYPVYLWASKSWADQKSEKVMYQVDQTLLDEYNKSHSTTFELLPTSCYSMDKTEFVVNDKDKVAKFKVHCSPDAMIKAGAKYGESKFALPIRILVDGERQDDHYSTVIVSFKLMNPLFSLDNSSVTPYVGTGSEGDYGLKLPYQVNFINDTWINFTFGVNEDLVSSYNTKNGTDYKPFPSSLLSWDQNDAVLDKGVNKGSVQMYADLTSLTPGDKYLLPIQLKTVSHGNIDPDNDCLYYTFDVMYPRISQSNWMAQSVGSTAEGDKSELVDDVVSSSNYWHYNWNTSFSTAWIILKLKDLSKSALVSSLEVFTRQGNTWGNRGQKAMDMFVSMDGTNWTKAGSYKFLLDANNKAVQSAQLATFDTPQTTKYIKIVITDHFDAGICFSEIYMHGKMLQ
jgi:hypothetical protein